jgi:hypothetical protein
MSREVNGMAREAYEDSPEYTSPEMNVVKTDETPSPATTVGIASALTGVGGAALAGEAVIESIDAAESEADGAREDQEPD